MTTATATMAMNVLQGRFATVDGVGTPIATEAEMTATKYSASVPQAKALGGLVRERRVRTDVKEEGFREQSTSSLETTLPKRATVLRGQKEWNAPMEVTSAQQERARGHNLQPQIRSPWTMSATPYSSQT